MEEQTSPCELLPMLNKNVRDIDTSNSAIAEIDGKLVRRVEVLTTTEPILLQKIANPKPEPLPAEFAEMPVGGNHSKRLVKPRPPKVPTRKTLVGTTNL